MLTKWKWWCGCGVEAWGGGGVELGKEDICDLMHKVYNMMMQSSINLVIRDDNEYPMGRVL